MRRSYCFILTIFAIALVSCENDVIEPEKSECFTLEKTSLSSSEIEMLDKMQQASMLIVELANDNSINQELQALIDEKHYKDDFVLFKDLFSTEENLKSGKLDKTLFENAFDELLSRDNSLKSASLSDLKEYLSGNNLALYIPYPLEDYPENSRIPTVSFHPLINDEINEGYKPIIEDGNILGYNIVEVNEEFSLTTPVYLIIPKDDDEIFSDPIVNSPKMKSANESVDPSDDYIAIELIEYYVANKHQYDGIFAGASELRVVLIGLNKLSEHQFAPYDNFIDCTTSRKAIRKGTVIEMGTALKTDWEKAEKTITIGAYDYDSNYWDISDGRVGFGHDVSNSALATIAWSDPSGMKLVDTLTVKTGFTIGGTFKFKVRSHDDLLGQQTWGRNWIGQWGDGLKDPYSFGDFKCTFEAVSYNE
ncbi:MAG: hypothetical protein PF541_07025 [Prolixibacteraceae bacterium]|nr:hypothetical protein [Prolixibacteraceae bacterium]